MHYFGDSRVADQLHSYLNWLCEGDSAAHRNRRPIPATDGKAQGTEISNMQPTRSVTRHILFSIAFVLVYLFLNRPEVILVSQLGFTAWYPATGLILAVMLGINPGYVFLVWFCDALAGIAIYHQPLFSYSQLVGSLGTALSYCVAACILRGPWRIDLGLRRRQDVILYVVVTMMAAVVSTSIGVSCLAVDHIIGWKDFWSSASGWFFGDGIGLLGFAPFLLIHVLPRLRKSLLREDFDILAKKDRVNDHPAALSGGVLLEACAQVATLLAALWVIFGSALRQQELLYLSFIPVIWVAMRQGIRRVVTALLVLNFGIVLALHLYPPTPELVNRIGLLMLVVSAVGLGVGSVVTERHRMGLDLQERTVYLNSLIENSPLGIAVLDCEGRIETTNLAFRRLFLYDTPELEGVSLAPLLSPGDPGPADMTNQDRPLTSVALDGEALQKTVKRRRKDGRILDVELYAVPRVANGVSRGAFKIYKDISAQIKAAQAEREYAGSLNQLVSELEVRSGQMSLLNEMASLLECCGTMEEACVVVSRCVQKLFPAAHCGSLYLFKSSRNLVEIAEKWGESGSSEQVFIPDACWGLRRGKPHWSESGENGILCAHVLKRSTRKCLCVPMVGKSETIGVLLLEFDVASRPKHGHPPDRERNAIQELAVTAAGQIAVQLASLRLRETLRDQSIRDPLTGLFNRRFMEESLERELLRAARKNHQVSLLFLDLDHFKRFNDSFGHNAGDVVLRCISDLFRNSFRGDDVICRYGGEEFAIILPESSAANAAMRADALREDVRKLRPQQEGLTLGTVTISVGIATYPEHASTVADLLRAADLCLYESKKSGRDRVTVSSARQNLLHSQ